MRQLAVTVAPGTEGTAGLPVPDPGGPTGPPVAPGDEVAPTAELADGIADGVGDALGDALGDGVAASHAASAAASAAVTTTVSACTRARSASTEPVVAADGVPLPVGAGRGLGPAVRYAISDTVPVVVDAVAPTADPVEVVAAAVVLVVVLAVVLVVVAASDSSVAFAVASVASAAVTAAVSGALSIVARTCPAWTMSPTCTATEFTMPATGKDDFSCESTDTTPVCVNNCSTSPVATVAVR